MPHNDDVQKQKESCEQTMKEMQVRIKKESDEYLQQQLNLALKKTGKELDSKSNSLLEKIEKELHIQIGNKSSLEKNLL